MTAKWLAINYLCKYKSINAMRIVDLKDLVKEYLKVDLTLTKLRKAKQLTFEKMEGDLFKEYGRLWDYIGEIQRSNPGITYDLRVHRPIPTELPVFERLYISFECLKKGFLGGCKKILGLDGYFLKGTIKGKVLTAVRRDGNNQMFLVA